MEEGKPCIAECVFGERPHEILKLPTRRRLNRSAVRNLRQVATQLYKPLLPWETRIVEIEPSKPGRPLSCKLLKAELIHQNGVGIRERGGIVVYDAISYCWGQSKPTYPLTINGMQWTVTRNLASALFHLRQQAVSRHVWVDALCINQSDDTEKSVQVRNMFTIYQKASKVIAWLGDEVPDTWLLTVTLNRGYNHEFLNWIGRCRHIRPARDAFLDLLGRPWFRRTWVRQEVHAGKRVNFQCGLTEGPLDSLLSWRDSLRLIISSRWFEQVPHWDEGLMEPLRVLAGPSSQYTGKSLLDVLEEGTVFDASDAKDKVYGILGIVGKGDMRSQTVATVDIPIDYSKSVSEVYQDVAKSVLRSEPALNYLWRYGIQEQHGLDIPSWVIDWRHGVKTSFAKQRVGTGTLQGRWQQIDLLKAFWKPQFEVTGTMKIKGYVIGALTSQNTSGAAIEKSWTFLHENNVRSAMDQQQSFYSIKFDSDTAEGCRYGPSEDSPRGPDVLRWEVSEIRSLDGHAIAPCRSATGDMVVFFLNCPIPFLLRRVEGGYLFLGPLIFFTDRQPQCDWYMGRHLQTTEFHII